METEFEKAKSRHEELLAERKQGKVKTNQCKNKLTLQEVGILEAVYYAFRGGNETLLWNEVTANIIEYSDVPWFNGVYDKTQTIGEILSNYEVINND